MNTWSPEGTFIIAEMSANHNQSKERAIEIIHAAKEAGADAIKIQTYTADTITLDCDRPEFTIQGGLWCGQSLHALYQSAYTPWEWQAELKQVADDLGLTFFSAPFDPTAIDFLESIDVPIYKIASFEIVDIPLIRRAAQTRKPMIISTGMASLADIELAVATALEAGCPKLALLKCTSNYPALPEEMHLRTIPHMAEAFQVPVGLSDHTMGTAVPVAAVALGASIIEKHLTLSRSDKGPDSEFSLEPREFKEMVDAVRIAERALGQVSYGKLESEISGRAARRSLYVVKDIKAGESFTTENIRSIRPGHGLPPKWQDLALKSQASMDIERGTPLSLDHIRTTLLAKSN